MRSVAQGVGVSFRWRKKRVEGVVWVGQNTAEELVVIYITTINQAVALES